jgi:hypothetical protein
LWQHFLVQIDSVATNEGNVLVPRDIKACCTDNDLDLSDFAVFGFNAVGMNFLDAGFNKVDLLSELRR